MQVAIWRIAMLIVAGLACATAPANARDDKANQEAVTGTVSGEKIQKVGFRATIQKQAIMSNLAGAARNNPDGTVSISLQVTSIESIGFSRNPRRKQKSSTGNAVSLIDAPRSQLEYVHGLRLTSTSRNMPTRTTWFFTRDRPTTRYPRATAAVWNSIAESALKGDDLAKFMNHLESDD
jgi:acylphosphatase